MTLKEQLKEDVKVAMREKNVVKRDAVRSINTMIKQIEVDERRELGDDEIIKLIQKGIKQREESIVQYTEAGREDLIEKEKAQADKFRGGQGGTFEDIRIEHAKVISEMDLDGYAGTFFTPMYGDIMVKRTSAGLRLEFEHAPLLGANLSHWHFDTFEIDWDVPHAWFDWGTVQFDFDQEHKITGISIDVPNNDIFFDELLKNVS